MRVISLLFASLLAVSCSGGRIGYYVALWPPEESSLKPGESVKVVSESDIRDVYVIEKDGKSSREEVPRTSGKFFKKKKEADAFLEKFEPYRDIFAYSERSLIIRTEPEVSSGREYRLRPSQVVKIVDRLPGPVEVGNLSGYWYQVLTDDGFEGYCFDKYLTVYEYDSAKTKEENEKDFMDSFFGNVWYPSSYLENIRAGRLIIENLETGEGIFPDSENRKIVIQTPQERLEFSYDGIVPSGSGSIYFSGTPVEISFYSEDKIYVKYTHSGLDYSAFYTLLDKPVEEYIDEELERREGIVESFVSRGKNLVSALYGSMQFMDDGRFSWTGYINLVPEIIPFGYGNSGHLRIDYLLSEELADEYDGVFSFVFDRNNNEIIFAYVFTDGGVQFTHVPPEYAVNGVVDSFPEDSHVYYFRQNRLTDEAEEG